MDAIRWELYEMWLRLAWRRPLGSRSQERAAAFAVMYGPR